ncbi:hypothetical protein FMO13_11105 [Xanthomonas phaseoli pv. dieffenbachiae]
MQGEGNGQEQAAAHHHFQAEGEGAPHRSTRIEAATTPSTRREEPSRAPFFDEFSVTRAQAMTCACRGVHAGQWCVGKSTLPVRSPIASIVA